jgi:hypothetical protein
MNLAFPQKVKEFCTTGRAYLFVSSCVNHLLLYVVYKFICQKLVVILHKFNDPSGYRCLVSRVVS